MPVVDIRQAQAQLISLLAQVEVGKDIVIARNGKPIARLVSCECRGKRQFGALKGQISIDDRFFDPLPEAELTAWDK